MPAADTPGRQSQGGPLLRRQPVLARQGRMLIALGRGQPVKHGFAAQGSVSGEQRPPFLSLSHQDGPVGCRLVGAPDHIDPGLSEAGGIRSQELLETAGRGEGAAEPGVPFRRIAVDAEEGDLFKRGHRLEGRQAGILVNDRESEAVAPIMGPQQVPTEPPGHLTGLGIPQDDSGDAGNEDDRYGGRGGRRALRQDAECRPRAAGGEQEDRQKNARQGGVSLNHLQPWSADRLTHAADQSSTWIPGTLAMSSRFAVTRTAPVATA